MNIEVLIVHKYTSAVSCSAVRYSIFNTSLNGLTLTLHTCVEKKRARVHQMWLRTGSTVVDVLSEASTATDGVLSRERSGLFRCRYGNVRVNLIS